MDELDLDARLDAVTIAEPARPYYGRMTIDEVLSDALTRIEEWDYESDAHGYCHERSDWLALVAEVRRLRALVPVDPKNCPTCIGVGAVRMDSAGPVTICPNCNGYGE